MSEALNLHQTFIDCVSDPWSDQYISQIILSIAIMLHLWVNADTKKIKTGLPDFQCFMLF